MGLLDAGVHEHGAAGAQVDGLFGKQAHLGEVGDVGAQGLGKGLDKGAAPGGAGLVEHDGVHCAVADLETLHVLTADVDDEIHIGVEVGGGLVVGHRLHQAQVTGEGVFDQVLAIAGDRRAFDLDAVAAQLVDFFQLLQDDGDRVAQVGVVVGVEQSAVGGDEGQFGGGGACIHPQPSGAGVSVDVRLWGPAGIVPGQKSVVLLLRVKERGHGVRRGVGLPALLQPLQGVLKGDGLVVGGAQGCAHGGEAVPVFRKDGMLPVQLQGLHKTLPQAHQEVEGPAQKDDLSLQLPALGEAGYRLVHHRLEDGGGYVLFPTALVQDGLDIALGEHTAAACNGVDLLVLQGEGVQLVHRHIHQGGHLVDEGARPAGAGAVHSLLQRTAEKDDLGVLAAQLDDGIGVRNVGVHRGGGGVHFLDEVQAGSLGQPQAGGAGDDQLDPLAAELARDGLQGLTGPLPGLGVVPLIGAEQQLVLFIQHHHFHRGGADVDTDAQTHKSRNSYRWDAIRTQNNHF